MRYACLSAESKLILAGNGIMDIVLVYLGTRTPRYALLNLSLLRARFPNNRIVFLSDSSKNIEKAKRIGVESTLVPSPEENWSIKPKSFSHDTEFRSGFWYKTFARFYALGYFSQQKPLDSFLHVESDVLLLPSFPLQQFNQIKESMAYPLSTTRDAAASTLYVKNHESYLRFMNFAELRVVDDPTSTDMSVLAQYAAERSSEVLVLPSALPSSLSFTDATPSKDFVKFSQGIDFFDGIFDANTWGQFLTGQDPKNAHGISKVYHHMPHHAVEPRNYEVSFEKNLFVTIENQKRSLHSLHIHSKNAKYFRLESSQKSVQKAITDSRFGPTRQIYVWYAVRFFPNLVKKKLRKGFKISDGEL